MANRATQLGRGVLWLLSVLLGISFLTGLGLWWIHELREKGQAAPGWSGLCQILHGLVNPIICVLYGWLWHGHMAGGWRMAANRKSGAALAVTTGLLILTGAAIYYTRGGHLFFSIHLLFGFLLPIIVGIHLVAARKWIRRSATDSPAPR